MKRLLDLSLRHKLPLWGSGLILAATLAVAGGEIARAFDDLKGDLVVSSQRLGRTLAKTLFSVLLHDDTWRAVELIEAPLHGRSADDPMQPRAIFVVDQDMKILVSSLPRAMPILTDLDAVDAEHARLAASLRHASGGERVLEFSGSPFLHVAIPLAEEGARLGTLVITHTKDGFMPRFFGIALGSAGMGGLVLTILLPLNWYWGRRMALPLVQLANGVAAIARGTPTELNPDVYAYHDEVGQLYSAFRQASDEMRGKAALEREVLQSERLAAVGRLAAGIAHEVNNPLAGMLMAVDNAKQRQPGDLQLDARMERTLDFLQRGLQHLSETVGALLVQARVQARPLSVQDFDDLRTLIEPQALKKSLHLAWSIGLDEGIDLPSSLVRQIVINLLLNAVQAAPSGGEVRLEVECTGSMLSLKVSNEGELPPPQIQAHIFEPFVSGRSGGFGLGLWVTYQTVQQLGGHIALESVADRVVFRVELPVREAS